MLNSEFGGMDRDKAQMLAQDGKLSDTFALKYAMHSGSFGGLGTDEALLRTTLEGKTKAEIDKIKADYQTAGGKPLMRTTSAARSMVATASDRPDVKGQADDAAGDGRPRPTRPGSSSAAADRTLRTA